MSSTGSTRTSAGGKPLVKPVAGHHPRRRFGQNFLTDRAVIEAIADAIAPAPGDRIVEIGPGLGALTAALLARTPRIAAIEIDRDLAARLGKRFGPERLDLHVADALAFDFAAYAAGGALRIVGNLPYNISSPLLVRLAALRDVIVDQHFMLQREVVQRITAAPGSGDYGRLTVLLAAHYDSEMVLAVPPEAFEPPPRVDSAVVRMRVLPRPRTAALGELSAVLSVAFGQRRKMLRGTLLPWLAARGVAAGGINPTARAEELAPADYFALAEQVALSRQLPDDAR